MIKRPLFSFASAFGAALLLFGLAFAAQASDPLGQWRAEVAAVRRLAENDGPRALEEARRLLADLPADAPAADRSRALCLLARAELYLAMTEAAGEHAEQALALAIEAGDRVGRAEAHLVLALNTVNQGRIDALVASATGALEALDGVADRPDLLSEAMLRVGMMYRRLGRLDDSVTLAMRAMEMAERSGDPLALTHAHNGLAYSYELSGHPDKALGHFEAMARYARLSDSARQEAAALRGIGGQLTALGRLAEGEETIRRAIAVYRRIGGPFYLAHTQYLLADNLRLQGRRAEALPLIDELVGIYERRANKIGLWWALGARGDDRQALGDWEGAWSDAERTYQLAKEIGLALYLGGSAKRMAALAAVAGDHRKAYGLAAEALELAAKTDGERAGERMLELTERYVEESHRREIEALSHRNERQTAELTQRALRQRWLWTLVAASLLLLFVTGFHLLRQRRANRMLRAANADLALRDYALDHVGEAAYLVDEHARILYVNEEACRSLGYGRDELLAMTVADIDPDWSAEQLAQGWTVLEEQGTDTMETRHRRKDGSLFPVEINGSHFSFEGRGFVLSLVRDITERKRAEAALVAREREFRILAESLPDNIVRYDLAGRTRYVNPALERTLGTDAEAMLGITIRERHPGGEFEDYAQLVDSVLATGEAGEIEKVLPVPGGPWVHQIRAVPERDARGELIGVLAIGHDITARKRAEETLRASEERYRLVFENSPVSLWEEDFSAVKATFDRLREEGVVDLESHFEYRPEGLRRCAERVRIVDVNRAAVALHDAPNKATLLAGLSDTFTAESFDTFRQELIGLWNGETAMATEAVVKTLAGELRYVTVHFAVCPGYEASLARVLVSLVDITERKRAEQRMRQALEFTEGVINAIPDVLIEVDGEGRYLNVWTREPELLAAPKETLIGRTVHEVLSPEAAAEAMAGIREAEANGLSFGRVLRIDLPDGTRWFEQSLSKMPMADPAGPPRFLVLSRDVTERKLAEEALAAREREFHSLAENIPDHIIRYDVHARKTYLNSSMARLIGGDARELLGRTPEETPPKARALNIDEYARRLRSTLSTGEAQEFEAPLRHSVEGLRTYNVRFVAERGEDGGVVGALMMGRDITERKRAEEALAARERQFRTLAESLPDNVVRYDLEGRTLYVNPVLERTLGAGAEKMLGTTIRELNPGGEFDDYADLVDSVLATGEAGEIEKIVPAPDGVSTRVHQIRAIPERDDDGELIGVLAIGQDVTALKEAERLLREFTARREAAREEERKHIAREIHDELGQQLTALRMSVSLIRLQFGSDQPAILEHAQRMMELVDQTIGVVRHVAASLRPAALDMGVGSALEWLAAEFTRRTEIPCRLRLQEPDLSLTEERSTALFRIVQESLTNVARYARANEVVISLMREGERYRLEVRDDGVGFDPSIAKPDSFGLVGLRERAQMLGGELTIDSAPGRGTVISLRIPV